MYAEGGHVYIFLVYGMHYQLNFVTGPADHPHAILIRAVEPIEGIELMRERRGKMADKNLTSGPGKLCKAFAIDKTLNGAYLAGSKIWIEEFRTAAQNEIASGTRIGIDYAGEDAKRPWRFWLKGNTFVSR
jgi:DNA-3-methyladenine glycosylase